MLPVAVVAEQPDPVPLETPWLTLKEAAAYTRQSERTIRRAARSGALQSSGGEPGKPYMFKTAWLDYWMEHRR